MTSVVEEFAENPSVEAFERLTKEQLLEVANYYKIDLTSSEKRLKHTIKSVLIPFLVEKCVLPPVDLSDAVRLKELSIREKELDNDRELLRLRAIENELELKKLELLAKQEDVDLSLPTHIGSFDVSKQIKLVPPFVEKDIENYFPHFEKVATTLNWPKVAWTLLIQSVLTGRAQEVYTSLSLEQSGSYDVVKASILRAYELVPESYRQRFRRYKKSEQQTYVEFAREKEMLFDRWCSSKKVDNREKLRDLMLVEDFKNCLPDAVSTYLNEQKAETLREAAVLADEYVLTHKLSFGEKRKPAYSQSNLADKTVNFSNAELFLL